MLSYPSVCFLLVAICSSVRVRSQLHGVEGDGHILDSANGFRMKRSMIAIGNAALKALLDGATFLHRNGLDKIYSKPGGAAKATRDFERTNEAKRVFQLPLTGQLFVSKVGKVGDKTLILRDNISTGGAELMITPVSNQVDPLIYNVIIKYKD